VAAFNDATLPVMGIAAIRSHALRTIGVSPGPSAPTTKIAGSGSEPVKRSTASA
jgi:hypothetical protein